MTLLLLGCLTVGAVSLLSVSAPTYDPWAWIIWGREIAHLDLVTTEGPSWKPLPVLFTTPFSLFGEDAAPQLWLVVARAGGLLAFAMAFRLGERLAGLWAGVIAALSLVLCESFIRDFARGNSEGMLVAIVLWAVERHLEGRRTQAFLLGFAAALLRPELWPLWGLYGLWLVYRAWDHGPPRREIAVVAGCAVACLLLWFLPEYLGSGDWLRAASRARNPNPGSPAYADSPFLEVFRRSQELLTLPVHVGALIATALGLWRREHVRIALAAMAAVLMVAVAAMTQFGFAGNLRYVELPAAIVCVLAGAGWVDVVRLARGRAGLVVAAAVVAAIAVWWLPYARDDVRRLRSDRDLTLYESAFYGPSLKTVIAKAGGVQRLKACRRVFAGPYEVPAVAWRLGLHQNQIEIFAFGPGTAFAMRGTHLYSDPRYPVVAHSGDWVVRSSCSALHPAVP